MPILYLLLTSLQGDLPTAQQCQRAIAESHSAIQDLSFIYEGRLTNRPTSAGGKGVSFAFQGHFAYRCADGATFVDVYRRSPDGTASVERSRMALTGNKLERFEEGPDQSTRPGRPDTEKGSGGSLNQAFCPNRFLWLWFFRDNPDLSALDYEFLGFEDLDGRVCWHFQVNRFPGGTRKSRNEFWVDVGRGGHPLRVEMYRNDRLFLRVRDVQLKQVPSGKEKSVWLPIRATVDGFDESKPLVEEPIGQENYELVSGSVLVNRGLHDDRFRIEPSSPDDLPSPLRAIDGDLKTAQHETAERSSGIRTDPEGVRQKLEEQLALADQQARQLEASSPARERFGSASILRWGLVSLGVVLAVVAVLLVRRGHG